MDKHFLLFVFLSFTFLVRVQAQSGFINIDCGIDDNSSYVDEETSISYVSDVNYIDTGVSKSISPSYNIKGLERQFITVRSFPQGMKNCYTLKPQRIRGRTNYFVRARFMYGNYDGLNQVPTFDLYLGVDYWDVVEFKDVSTPVTKEILHVPSSTYTYVCLVDTGHGTPFISVLDLRLADDHIYQNVSQSLALYGRFDLRSSNNTDIIRYKDDIFDRIWRPVFWNEVTELSTSLTIDSKYENIFKVPSIVMTTAVTPQNASMPLEFYWTPPDPTVGFYIYMHFTDYQSNQSREFDILLNQNLGDKPWCSGVKLEYLYTTTVYSDKAETPAARVNISLVKTENSTLPPMLNALEVYTIKEFLTPQTDQEDVDAIKDIKASYEVKKNWQGDPCVPNAYIWEGVNCFNDSFKPPRITYLNLNSSGLSGNISFSIYNLKVLQYLDLSNNNLTGAVPGFLSQMTKLTVLNLTGNNLTGTVPTELLNKSKSGSLTLSMDGNPNLCITEPCENGTNRTTPEKKKSMVIPIVAAVASVFVLLLAFAILWMCFLRKRKSKQPQQHGESSVRKTAIYGSNITPDTPIKARKQTFTYAEVLMMTRNLQRVLGKGGFGEVYHGYLEDTQVAVKMLSPSSAQGYKQFKAEAELLMRVHHVNLTSLVGYCDEGDKLGLIYEYMANGDLETHLTDRNMKFISWELRLEIALDAAHGLEYLHTGCRPAIVHRDVKSTNILLNDRYHAKLADFGLSKAFATEGSTHVSTAFAGTPGYFDPEFNMNEKSDVYSFGVVLLEIITGQPPIARTKERTHLSQWVTRTLQTKGDVRDVLDPRLGRDFDLNSVWKVVDIAMECVSHASSERPTMNVVVIELKACLVMEKARVNKDYQSDSNYDSVEMSNHNIEHTGMSPFAR